MQGCVDAPLARQKRHVRFVLATTIAASIWLIAFVPAMARTPHRAAGHVAAISSRHPRLTRRAGFTTVRFGSARAAQAVPSHLSHGHRLYARASAMVRLVRARPGPALHADVVPLANTVWEDAPLSPAVLGAVRAAARDSGVDPDLLMALAWRESRFDPQARNRQSSATGLLQFTSGTWLQTVQMFGARHGVGNLVASIRKDRSGEFGVPDPRMRHTILELRRDPVLAAGLAGDLLARQRTALRAWLGRDVTSSDLYLQHVLGTSGAARFLTALAEHPSASSLDFASRRTLRNGGLLARDGCPMTVTGTYAAVGAMLDALKLHSQPILTAANDSEPVPYGIRH